MATFNCVKNTPHIKNYIIHLKMMIKNAKTKSVIKNTLVLYLPFVLLPSKWLQYLQTKTCLMTCV